MAAVISGPAPPVHPRSDREMTNFRHFTQAARKHRNGSQSAISGLEGIGELRGGRQIMKESTRTGWMVAQGIVMVALGLDCFMSMQP